jgi:hypothetical protein
MRGKGSQYDYYIKAVFPITFSHVSTDTASWNSDTLPEYGLNQWARFSRPAAKWLVCSVQPFREGLGAQCRFII